jgi:dipeptidyl aminopeptidase/acylaminoacyl peptidase
MLRRSLQLTLAALAFAALPISAQDTLQSERWEMFERYKEFWDHVKGGRVQPHWMADGNSFWYLEGGPDSTVVYTVDPVANRLAELFDVQRVRAHLRETLGEEPPGRGLPFEDFRFVDEREHAVRFTVQDGDFVLDLDSYELTRASGEESETRLGPSASPDGRWVAEIEDSNVWVRSTVDGHRTQLTADGQDLYAYGNRWWEADRVFWSPDGNKLAVRKADFRAVPKTPVVDWLGPVEEVEWHPYPRSDGSPSEIIELVIIDVPSGRLVPVDVRGDRDQWIHVFGWRPDGTELLVARVDRDGKRLDLMAADASTGATRTILTETAETFVFVAVFGEDAAAPTLLAGAEQFIWRSERDGWSHLYLYDYEGNLLRRLTQGPFPVNDVIAVDETDGWVYFIARHDRARPHDVHLCRVSLLGEDFARLTEAHGFHGVQFSPSKAFYLDTHESVGRPPVVELHRADGTLLRTLSDADISALEGELRWVPAEEFVVKAADGETDLWGTLYKPYDFDPAKKYPVIQFIYTSIYGTWAPGFGGGNARRFAQLGFITIQMALRGEPQRGKAFRDAFYGRIGCCEHLDGAAALRQLAAERPYIDLSRVGIFGGSWGGYHAARFLLLAPDAYHVGVAERAPMELTQLAPEMKYLMGLPEDNPEGWAQASNIRFADRLQGKLLLVAHTDDVPMRLSSTMKMIDALIQAGKPYDLILVPGVGHSHRSAGARGARAAEYVWWEAVPRYFVEHLKP